MRGYRSPEDRITLMSREKPPKLRDVPRASELRHNFRDRVGRYSPLLDAAGHDSDVRYRSCQRRSSSHESSLVSRPESDAVFINPALDGKGEDIIGGHRRKKQGDFVASYSISKMIHSQKSGSGSISHKLKIVTSSP